MKKDPYLLAAAIMIIIGITITIYPLVGFYLNIYIRSSHGMTPGSSFFYGGTFSESISMPEGLGNYGYVLSVEYLGDDLFHINATLYGFVNGTLFASSLNPHFPFQPHGTVVIVEQKDFNATYSSSNLLTVLLPRNETVYFNGQEYEIFALNRSIYRPSTLGFPRIYTIPLNQSQGAVEAIHYVRTENCYIATGVYENITFVTQLFSANISANQGLCSLTYTSIVPADQDWAYGATFNFSFLAFPIPIVLFVAGLLLLILRARRS